MILVMNIVRTLLFLKFGIFTVKADVNSGMVTHRDDSRRPYAVTVQTYVSVDDAVVTQWQSTRARTSLHENVLEYLQRQFLCNGVGKSLWCWTDSKIITLCFGTSFFSRGKEYK